MRRLAWPWWPLWWLVLALGLGGGWLPAQAVVIAGPTVSASGPLEVPNLTARANDLSATLSSAELLALEQHLAGIEQRLGSQIVVLMVPSTGGEDIAGFAYRVASTWKVGRRSVGDGIVIIVAKNDRRVRIEVARALEGAVPDLAARRIIDQAMVPAFRDGRYAEGLTRAADLLAARIAGEGLPGVDEVPATPSGGSSGFDWGHILMVLFMAVPVVGSMLRSLLGRKLGAAVLALVASAVAWWISQSFVIALAAGVIALLLGAAVRQRPASSPGFGRHTGPWGGGGLGGGSGWSSGGGFSSGGGGSFGGGGSSGNW